MRTHETEETTLDGCRGYVRRTIEPALGGVSIAKITPHVLDLFYADLHRCRSGEPALDHRTTVEHECRTIRHTRKPGRPGPEPHDCVKAGSAWKQDDEWGALV